jgi:hypothetical protein
VPEDTGGTKVAANGTINSAPNHPNPNPAPVTTPALATNAAHHQS